MIQLSFLSYLVFRFCSVRELDQVENSVLSIIPINPREYQETHSNISFIVFVEILTVICSFSIKVYCFFQKDFFVD